MGGRIKEGGGGVQNSCRGGLQNLPPPLFPGKCLWAKNGVRAGGGGGVKNIALDFGLEIAAQIANHQRLLIARNLDIFETPVTVTPQQEISKTLNSSKIPLKYLTFTFGERTFAFGDNWGFRVFWNFYFFFVAGCFFTLPALQKNFVNIFFVFDWEFCIEKWWGFLVNFFWSPSPTKESTKSLRKIRGKFGAKLGAKFGTKIRKIREPFVLQLSRPEGFGTPLSGPNGSRHSSDPNPKDVNSENLNLCPGICVLPKANSRGMEFLCFYSI